MKTLVTGANGHVGFNLCKALLERGYDVRASVRSVDDEARTASLRALGVQDFVSLDVRNLDAFEHACQGVELLFHVAATYAFHTSGPAADGEMVRDSVEGAANAIRAAARTGVNKVVMTSSIVTLPLAGPGDPPATEADWNPDLRVPYIRAKVEGERAAWRVAEELGVRLVTVLPGAIGGPGFQRRTQSTDVIEGIMLGTMRMAAPKLNFPYVDIRDVTEGHVLAAQHDVAGRFYLGNDVLPSFQELTRMMHGIDPRVPAAPRLLPDFALGMVPFFEWLDEKTRGAPRSATPELLRSLRGKRYSASNARANAELGWEPRVPLEQSLAETMEAIRALRRREGRKTLA
ncbi:MAG: NAD-dependent epimerase/dehydratase family protein [Bryobacterales bacterium]|nr:NAD-dependent epimerase/dehydratase family protein [Bryobacterales bacterium]